MSIFTRQDKIDAIVTSIWLLQEQSERQQILVRQNPATRAGKSSLEDLRQTLQCMLSDIDLLTGMEGVCLWQTQKREYVAKIRKEFNIE